jgi:hypothetical protein
MKDLAASVRESCYFRGKERCSDRDLMAVAKEEFVALTKGESKDSEYEARRGLSILNHIHTYSTLKKKRNVKVEESKGS